MPDELGREEQLRKLAHDMRQCLHVIGMAAELLKDVREDETKVTELCKSIEDERKQAVKLVDQFLDTASRSKE